MIILSLYQRTRQLSRRRLPELNTAFSTRPLTLGQWGLCVAMSSAVLWFSELRKLWLRRIDANQFRAGLASNVHVAQA